MIYIYIYVFLYILCLLMSFVHILDVKEISIHFPDGSEVP